MKAFSNFCNARKLNFLRVLLAFVVLVTLTVTPSQKPVLATGNNCLTNTGSSGFYTITTCITVPADGAILNGTQTVTATAVPNGASPGIAKLIFYLNGEYLLTDYQAPYTFTLPTTKWVDGIYTLAVTTLMKDGYTSQPASSIDVTFNNGITTPPTNTNSFTPTSGTTPPSGQPFTLAVTGDGVDGATHAASVTDLINSWSPNLFVYVGDVYEKGSKAEFYNWYGTGNNLWARFRSITDPVVGNHEYENGVAPGYFDYWDNIPSYYSYDAAGWHFIALNSNCGLLRDCAVGQAQYQWLLNDLNTHNNVCTIAYFHHPPFNVGPEGYATSMNDMWALMAQHGVDIVLTGHDHDYQRWMPLDGNGNPSPTGITEFVAGGGGHGIQQFTVNPLDNRMVIGFDTSPNTFGALRMQLNQYGASFQYVNYLGNVLDSGAVPCNGAPTDTTAPTVPTNLTATTSSSTRADLSWGSSNDNVGVAGYNLYRNGTLLTSLGVVNSYSDTNLTLGTTYSYQVKARDAAGNLSNFSNTAAITTPILLFSDGFESGNFSAWTSNTNITVQQQEVYAGAYAARATSKGSLASYVSKTLSSTYYDLYSSLRFKIISKSSSTSAYVERFRGGATGGTAIAGVLISSTNKLGYRNDVTGTSNTNGPTVTLGVWHQVQTHLHIDPNNAANGQIEIWYDGVLVSVLSEAADFGITPISGIRVGDSQASDVFDEILDDVGVNTSFIDTTDSVSPSQPTGVSATATAPDSVNLTWNAASDNINVTGYNLFRNNGLLATVGAVTNYTDTPVSPGFTYNYQVQARDAAGNVSALSAVSTVTTPADTTPPTVTLTGPADGITANANVVLSADASDNVDVEDVDFLIDGNIVGTVGEGGPYQVTWDSTTVPDGPVTITARAVDTSGNTTTSSSRTIEVFNAAGDTTPPSTPTSFTVTPGGASRADLAWNASTDNVGVVAYDVYRDDALLTSVGAVTSYSDTNVQQGATYQYKIQARDAVGNLSGFTSNVSVTIPAPLFHEGFESGNLTSWTNNGLTIYQQGALEGQYDVEALSTAGTANYATRTLTAQNDLYYTTWFKINSHDTNSVFLQRFRTSGNVAILGTFVSGTGKLGYRNDITPGTITSTTSVSSGVWHQLQTHVHVNGASSQVEIWLDGVQVAGLSNAESLGNNPIGIIQLGENSTGKNFDVVFDELTFDTSFIRSATTPYTIIDSGPVGTVASNSANFSFSSTAANATFECSLDSAAFTVCVSPQNLTGLVDGLHTFAVRSRDALSNVDPTPASITWMVDTSAPTITNKTPADSAIDIALAANVEATFSEAMNPASLTTSSFTLVQQSDGTPITATVTYDSATKKATLDPASGLSYQTVYVATVKGGVGGATDAIGNPLASDVNWSFTTTPPDTTLPNVTILAPANGANVGGTVTLSADASDNIAVDHVDFLVNGTMVGTAASAPYTVNWNSTTLPNGVVTVTAHAVDTSANSADASINVTIANDVTPPSAPTNLAATTASSAKIDLTWTASTDNVEVTGYDIKRNGTLLASVGTMTSYSDTTAAPGTTYQYQVFAKDAAGNISSASNTASATTLAALFSDNFETGDMTLWTVNSGLSVQQQEVLAGFYAARATSNSSAVTNAYSQLATPQYDLYYDTSFKILSQDPLNSVYLLRLRMADTQSLLGVFVSATGKLGYRNDLSGTALTNGPSVSLNTWHDVQVHIHVDSVDPNAGLVEMWFDGTQVASQVEVLGTAPIARLQLGDSTAGRTYDIAFDNVVAANFYINPGDLTAPGVPSNLNANAISDSLVNLSWTAATDNVGVASYLIYRNGTLLAVTGAVTNYSDTTTVPLTSYQYEVRARDAAGNTSGASAPASVTTPADTTPPAVSVTSPSNGTLLSGLVTLAANATDAVAVDHVDFLINNSVVGSDNTAPYGVTWNSATSADGAVTITARAVDTSNNAAVSAGVNATLDNTPPDTTIISGPSTLTNATSATFSFTATEANSTFACSLDGSTFNSCVSPVAYTGLTSGSHTFQVRSTDSAGNTDGTPASQTWTVDTVAPTVTSTVPTSGATGVSPAANITAVFSEGMNAATITSSTFTIKIKQGNNPLLAATVAYDPATRTATLDPNANLSNSTTYTVTVKGGVSGVKDSVGNALASDFSWNFTTGVQDLTPPTVTLTTPANGTTVSGTVTLSANASDNVAVNHVDFLVNNAVVGTDTTSPYSVSWNSASIADGSATITARAVDNASNTTTSTGATVTVNNTSVDTTITAGPSGSVNTTSASFSFTATVTGSTFACSLDGSAFSACTSPKAYSALTNGSHTFQVSATNPSGFTDPSPASRTWTVDTVVPDTTITSGPTGTVGIASASFSFTSTEAGSSFTCSLDGAAFSSCSSPQNYTNLANGSHTFQVRAADAAGNVDSTPASRTWTVDTLAPDTTITAGPSGSVNTASASFSFTATEAGSTFACSLDGAAFSSCTSPKAYSGLTNGSHTFQVRATDAIGNTDSTPASRSWTIDTAAPTGVAITAPANGASVTGQVTISATASDNVGVVQVNFYVDGQLLASDTSAPFSTNWNTNKVTNTTHTLYVIATDAAGNATQSTTITVSVR